MRKLISAFLFFFVFDCNNIYAAWHNISFYSFNDNYTHYAGRVTIVDKPQFHIYWNTGTTRANYRLCLGPEYASGVYFQEYIAWIIVPKEAITTNGYRVYLDVQSSYGWSQEDTNNRDNYFFLNGYEWDTWTNDGGRLCPYIGHLKQINNKFNKLSFNINLPADLPKGHYDVPVQYMRGIQHHFYDLWRDHYKMPYELAEQLPKNNTVNVSFDNVGGCQPSSQILNIDHGNIVIDRVHGNTASQTLSIYCDVPVNVKISLLRNTLPIYNNKKFSVGLGNGWDSIISLNGAERSEDTLRWNVAGSKTVTIGSRLYGEAGKIKPGNLSGSMTMVLKVQ
ncbi:PapG carbohydrate binding domain-containing protein [Escherichia coli]|uniref:PapG carbohydrate binding domain-containing protein n=2 Tax=Escherichia coli TaxID=562 RepID=UPI000CFCB13B|nr:PapG carbohydrate binding domain-containing protein [Escherichia coli]